MSLTIADQAQRQAAIDPARSYIVQAPAGSGKTELLIQRFLALLGRVEKPQQILAITFTRKAATEMRNRLLEALTAAHQACPAEEHKAQTWHLARQALQRDQDKAWNILQNPALLAIQTIDSFNSSLVRKMPWLSRFGGLPELADDPEQLYLKATERLLQRLGTDQPGSASIKRLLAHLDNNMARLQQMLVAMLQKRDQWLRHLYGIRDADPCDLLEDSLAQVVALDLAGLAAATPQGLCTEILACGRTAAANLAQGKERPLLYLTDLEWMPRAESAHLPLWQGLADLLLAGVGTLRKPGGINAGIGFPASDNEPRARMQQLVEQLAAFPLFIEKLDTCRNLPDAKYPPEQRLILACLIELLPLLVGELWLVFRGEGQADYAEIALMAMAALGSADDPSDLLLKLDSRLEHILVDEFQDTSWMQYGLLEMLTAGWQAGDGRSLFLVGDPMQSIYRFREAEVGLFLKSFEGQLGAQGPTLEPLHLCCNFRSQAGLVDWVNLTFAEIFPAQVDAATGSVPLAAATAVHATLTPPAVTLAAFNGRDDKSEGTLVAGLVKRIQQASPEHSIAILVRGRSHLTVILHQLREQGLRYQAKEIEYLGTQPVALDLLALVRALVHRADRLAWLTVLRAPWCGLMLSDLHTLIEEARGEPLPAVLQNPKRLLALSVDGQARLARIWPVLEQGVNRRGRFNLRQLLESCWLSLGGPACYNQEGIEDAALVFDLVEHLQKGGEMPTHASLEQGLAKLFAVPDTEADGRLQVMTIHKSKGLEFDHVILPGLGRMPAGNDNPLLRWLEHPQVGLLLAPIAAKNGGEQDPIYQFIGRLERQKQDFEASRLLYVAATRARQHLHLFAHAKENSKGELKPANGSLLAKLWPVIEAEFCRQSHAAVAEERESFALNLRRLSLDWSLPQAEAAPIPEISQANKASAPAEEETLFFSGWEQQSLRHVGTLVHTILEQIGRQGCDFWVAGEVAQQDQRLKRQLASLGVPAHDQGGALTRIREAVNRTLSSQQGQWILHAHREGACELELSGQIAGQAIHAVIDRTFIDENGTRWVIDYKTSSPKVAEKVESFIQRETDHYRTQLSGYLRLMAAMEPQREIRAALYFPMIDHFVELDDGSR
ncbi:UvrD-helicase domain-containing protein [Geopsychrobacter electrodiphilus]|uniref:UvrD-helicase domain-containing protein n=1 Tax=Geopsychrobacter electrodiphilus TaxID=225196 RepID=UPI00037B2747|nr:UvrD-helicase domain-containing protein [Geopsychrobacter electrodiphilus]